MTYETKNPQLSLYRGLPGSGKSTDARKYQLERAKTSNRQASVVIVERDIIRRELDPSGQDWYTKEFEERVTELHRLRIRANLEAKNDVLVSDTNLPNRSVKQLIELGVRSGADVEIVDLRNIPLERVLARNFQRQGTSKYVDPDYINTAHVRFIAGKTLSNPVIPTLEELLEKDASKAGVPLKAAKYIPHPMGVPTVLVDLDGTLADHDGRNPYDTSKYAEDLISGNVLDTVLGLHNAMDYRIDIMTGREEKFRQVCVDWLAKHGVPYTELHMRPNTPDGKPKERDDKVKLDLFEKHYRNTPDIAVQFCIDDRARVVRMYRDVLGLQVFQVNDGDF